MPGETIGTKTKNKTFYETFPWRKKIFVNAFIDNEGFPQDFSPSCLVSHELQYHTQCNAIFACFWFGHNCTKYKPLLKSTSKEKTSLCLREKQFSLWREFLFSETERCCFFTSALKQGLVLCTIMTKPKTSKNGIALSVILQLMWN